jgi:hypothetical protein
MNALEEEHQRIRELEKEIVGIAAIPSCWF